MIDFALKVCISLLWKIARFSRRHAILIGQMRDGRQASRYVWRTVEKGPMHGLKVWVFAGERGNTVVQGEYEREIIDFLLKQDIDLKGKCVWDIGAHFGYLMLTFASLVGPEGRVVAFEPNPNNVLRIRDHIDHNPQIAKQVEVLEIALADVSGQREFKLGEFDDVADLGFLKEIGIPTNRIPLEIYSGFGEIVVTTARVDDLVEELGRSPDLIKIDVEGSEALVLEGAENTLIAHKPILLIEVHNVHTMHSVTAFLSDKGYASFVIEETQESDSRAFVYAYYEIG